MVFFEIKVGAVEIFSNVSIKKIKEKGSLKEPFSN